MKRSFAVQFILFAVVTMVGFFAVAASSDYVIIYGDRDPTSPLPRYSSRDNIFNPTDQHIYDVTLIGENGRGGAWGAKARYDQSTQSFEILTAQPLMGGENIPPLIVDRPMNPGYVSVRQKDDRAPVPRPTGSAAKKHRSRQDVKETANVGGGQAEPESPGENPEGSLPGDLLRFLPESITEGLFAGLMWTQQNDRELKELVGQFERIR